MPTASLGFLHGKIPVMNRRIRLPFVMCLWALVSGRYASHPPSCGEPVAVNDNTPRRITVLGDDLAPLRSAFNDASDQWRAVALVSPTCSECLLGANAVQKEITARYPVNQV